MTAAAVSPTLTPRALAGTTVVVLGGSSGIGLAVARLATEAGARVTVAARSGDRVEAAAEQLRTAGDGAVRAVAADVTDPVSLDRLFDVVGDLDHVYVAAGGRAAGPVVDTPADAVRGGVEERLWGAYETIRRAVPRMRPGGSLTFTSGPSAVRALPAYTVSTFYNAGIEAFVRPLAVEIAPLRANVVRPGLTDTAFLHDFLGTADPDTVAAAGAGVPLGRVARPEEVAAAVLSLMTNPYVTGTTLVVDGGMNL